MHVYSWCNVRTWSLSPWLDAYKYHACWHIAQLVLEPRDKHYSLMGINTLKFRRTSVIKHDLAEMSQSEPIAYPNCSGWPS